MKSFYILSILILACQSTTKNFGEQFTPKNPVTIDALLEKVTKEHSAEAVQLEGKIEKSCMSEGCWFTIKDQAGKEIRFDVKDKKFRVPTNSPGQEVVVLADATQDSTSEQEIILEVRGIRYQ